MPTNDRDDNAFIVANPAAAPGANPGAALGANPGANPTADCDDRSAVRSSDDAGPQAGADPRLAAQLERLRSRPLSQFSMAVNGVRLVFWGEEPGSASCEIYIEHETIDIAHPQQPTLTCDWHDPALATSLLASVGVAVRDVTVAAGRLSVAFANGLAFGVDPDERFESWQINSDDGLLVVCVPGGELAVWCPRGA